MGGGIWLTMTTAKFKHSGLTELVYMRIIFLLAAAALLSSLPIQAQNAVTINGHKAHPYRILAKRKANVDLAGLQTRQSAGGYETHAEISLVPGLVVLEKGPQARQAATQAGTDPAAALTEEIQRLKATGLYEYVEPDYLKSISLDPTDQRYRDGTLWGLRNQGQLGGRIGADVNAPLGWDIAVGTTNIIVAVIDTGVNYRHGDLINQMWTNPNEIPADNIDNDNNGFIDDVYGINAITRTGDPDDDNGHGTHCAGTIGASANDGNPHVGVAWRVRLMGLKFLSTDGFGSMSDSLVCIDYAAARGANVISASYGSQAFSLSEYNTINNARSRGVLMVAAAGNDGKNNDTLPSFPCSYDLDNIISVAALDRYDRIADFSNYGRVSVDIGAPGVQIFSTWIGATNAYNIIDGTSMACPHVSGAAAVVWSVNPTQVYSEVRRKLLTGATKIPALAGITTTEGRLNLFRSLAGTVDGLLEIGFSPTPESPLRTGADAVVSIFVSDDFPVTNATINATFNGSGVQFLNNGTLPDAVPSDGEYTALIPVPAAPGRYQLSVNITAPGKTNFSTNIFYRAVDAPINDNFEDGTKIPAAGGIVFADNTLATLQISEDVREDLPPHAGIPTASKSVWWTWSHPTNTRVIMDTAGSDPNVLIAVYTNNTLASRIEVASSSEGPGERQPYVIFDAVAGVTYHIAIASVSFDQSGEVQLRVEPNGLPDNTRPTVTVTDPPSGIVIEAATNLVRFAGTAFDPIPNASGIASVTVTVNDELVGERANGTTNWVIFRQLREGFNRIEVVSLDEAGNASIPRIVTVTYRTPGAPNDLFGRSLIITNLSSSFPNQITTNATREFNEPFHGGNEGGHSLWYRFTPAQSGVMLVTVSEADFDSLLAVYRQLDSQAENPFDRLVPVASADDLTGQNGSEVFFAVRAGQTYYIAVDGFGGDSGRFNLSTTFRAEPVFEFTATVQSLNGQTPGTVAPSSGTFPANSAVSVTATPTPADQYEFAYFTNSTGFSSTSNPLTIVLSSDTALTAVFRPRNFTEGFESGGFAALPWQNNGWEVQQTRVAQGQFAASSGTTADRQTKVLSIEARSTSGIGSFAYFVSSERDFDKLTFHLNGQELGSWSGTTQTEWGIFTFQVPAGLNLFEWRYSKDTRLARGEDRAYIDNINLPISTAQVSPATLEIRTGAISIRGTPNSQYRLESSSDLRNWTTERTGTIGPSGTVAVPIDMGTSGTARFYRVRSS